MNTGVNKVRVDKAFAEDQALLIDAVEAAGDLAMSYFGRGLTGKQKSDNSPVSEADLAVDRFLKDRLTSGRSDYGWLSEETADRPERLNARRVWIADPIDGTRAFLAGKTDWTISVALVEDGEPVLGTVLNPAKSEFFIARRGEGAWLNGRAIEVSVREHIKNSRIIATKGFLQRKSWSEPWPPTQTVWANSVAYRMALIAAGEADSTISLTGKSEWDLAAATLLVQEAGGKVTNAKGASLRFNQPVTRIDGLISANPKLHEALIRRMRDLID
jgi:myo-inositol-1(or 4)-monophosphatase